MVETSLGAVVIDLHLDSAPLACLNFLKLCKLKYYNNVLIYNVQENFMLQTGDPTGTGTGGDSLFGLLYGRQARYFEDEIKKPLQHKFDSIGVVACANVPNVPNSNTSQFFITLRGDDLEHLDGKHTIFGRVVEGLDVLEKINSSYVDGNGRPYVDLRILHTYVLDDPLDDPALLKTSPASPTASTKPEAESVPVRLQLGEEEGENNDGRTDAEIQKSLDEKEAKSRAVVLEMIGDIPDADIKPPEEVLFIAKLNPVTNSEDLEIIFSRFGPCKCQVIRDYQTGDSLCFGFVEFTKKAHCEEAYFKMDNVLIDDRRIKVDFSQSVSKLWNKVNRKEKMSENEGGIKRREEDSSHRSRSRGEKKRSRRHRSRSREDKKHSKRHRSRSREEKKRSKRHRSSERRRDDYYRR